MQSVDAPPALYVDKGACPFEGCVYQEWTAKKAIELYDKPNGVRVVGHLRPGERVTGLTGEVHSAPIRVTAKENILDPEHLDRTMIPKGQAFYVLHYLGEGHWLAWYRGNETTVKNMSEGGPFPQATWWVQVKTSKGVIGWAISLNNFANQDRYG